MDKDKIPAEPIHQMIADHNAQKKTFYYTEEEVKDLCRSAYCLAEDYHGAFDKWWNNVKKK